MTDCVRRRRPGVDSATTNSDWVACVCSCCCCCCWRRQRLYWYCWMQCSWVNVYSCVISACVQLRRRHWSLDLSGPHHGTVQHIVSTTTKPLASRPVSPHRRVTSFTRQSFESTVAGAAMMWPRDICRRDVTSQQSAQQSACCRQWSLRSLSSQCA